MVERKVCLILDASDWGEEAGVDSCPKADTPPHAQLHPSSVASHPRRLSHSYAILPGGPMLTLVPCPSGVKWARGQSGCPSPTRSHRKSQGSLSSPVTTPSPHPFRERNPKYIEKDSALERRFQPVQVDEPSEEESISILRGIKDGFDAHHGVRLHDNALVAAVKLSNRYISDRFLPDKAIDLIDEAASLVKTQMDTVPEALDTLQRKELQMKIEEQALAKETDDNSVKRLKELREELATTDAAVKLMQAS